MFYINSRQIVIFALLMCLFLPVHAQKKQVYNDVKPFSGSSPFRKLSIGLNAGVLNPSVIIGGTNDFLNPQYTLGYGANIHYQLNHYLGIQADIVSGTLKANQNKKEIYGGIPTAGKPVSSFKTNMHYAGSLSDVLTFGNINWLNVKNTVVPYISAGAGYMAFDVKIVRTGTTNEVTYSANSPIKQFFVPVAAGIKFNLSSLINLDLGYRMHFVDGDNLDGSPFYSTTPDISSPVKKDKFGYGFAGLEFSFGNRSKPQLLFDNPAARVNMYLQNQVDVLKANQDKMMQDSDGDGVPDMFDKERDTPKGCPVDVHGVSLDSDGDGVPDCRDKELITATQCQPVDANGVGKCPEPDCCKNRADNNKSVCNIGDLPSISFSGNSSLLSSDAEAMLATVGLKLKGNPQCSITIFGYPAASKASQELCNKRLVFIKYYLVKTEDISADRIAIDCTVIGGGNANKVDIKSK